MARLIAGIVGLLWGWGTLGWTADGLDDRDREIARLRSELADRDRQIVALQGRFRVEVSTGIPPLPAPAPESPAIPPALAPIAGFVSPNPASHSEPKGSGLFDNLSLFAGLDGSKQPQDFGVNALFGGRFHLDWGIPLIKERGLGLQVGTAINFSDNAVGVFQRIEGTKRRLQNFTTIGLYQRTESGFSWGLGYDFLYEQYFDHLHLGQWRGLASYTLTDRDEVGARLMLRGYGARGFFGSTPVVLNPIDMGTLFYRRTFQSGATTGVWAGLADGHNTPNAALGDTKRIPHPFVFGAEVDTPLNDHLHLFGQANFITPASSGTVDAFLGLSYYPASKASRELNRRLRPVQAIAGNPTFAVDLGRPRTR